MPSRCPRGYRTHGVFIPLDKVRPSQDGGFHWCHRGNTVLCFFAPLSDSSRLSAAARGRRG